MDSKELLNWVNHPIVVWIENPHLIEVYAVKRLDSGMQFPLGKLPPNKMETVKELLVKYAIDLTRKSREYPALVSPIDTYWQKRESPQSYTLGVRFIYEGRKVEYKNVARIDNVDFTVSLEELEAKLYNGGTD